MKKNDTYRLFWTVCALIFTICMALYPQVVFNGALLGLQTWWNIVFPALLPFFIASELLMNFGGCNPGHTALDNRILYTK
jgi:nucleoside recognition membrane protein YjiH